MRAAFRALVMDGRAPAALEAAQALGRRGVLVDVACEARDCLAFHSRYVRGRLRQPPVTDISGAVEWLYAQYRERRFDLVVPSTDLSLGLLRALDERDRLRAKAVLPGNAALDIASDKQATRELAERLGIAVPRSVLIARGAPIPACAAYPVVLKSVRSRVLISGVNLRLDAVVAWDAAQRERTLSRWLPHTAVLQQEFVRGHGFGIELLCERGRPVWHFAHERLHELPLTGGASCYRGSIRPPAAMLRAAERLLEALEWHGVAMVEFRGRDAEDWHLMEINPRLWGSLALAIDCGVDFPWGLARLAAGERLAPQPAYRVGYRTRQVLDDLSWHRLNLRADHGDPLLLTRPRLRSAVEWLRPLAGCESWDHFDLRDPGVIARLLRCVVATRFGSRWQAATDRFSALARHRRLLSAKAARPRRVLFLCHGNICRSPVAEALARAAGIDCASAGFHDVEGRRTPQAVRAAAAAVGIDLSAHASRRVSAADVGAAGLVLCADLETLRALRREFPEALERVTLLGLFAHRPRLQIADPQAFGEAASRTVIASIAAAIEGLGAWLGASAAPAVPARPATATR